MRVIWTVPSPITKEEESSVIWTGEYLSESPKESSLFLIPIIWEEVSESIAHGWVEGEMWMSKP